MILIGGGGVVLGMLRMCPKHHRNWEIELRTCFVSVPHKFLLNFSQAELWKELFPYPSFLCFVLLLAKPKVMNRKVHRAS